MSAANTMPPLPPDPTECGAGVSADGQQWLMHCADRLRDFVSRFACVENPFEAAVLQRVHRLSDGQKILLWNFLMAFEGRCGFEEVLSMAAKEMQELRTQPVAPGGES